MKEGIPMNARSILPTLKGWFETYVRGFFSEDAMVQKNINMKKSHTHRVCDIIVDIGNSLALSPEDLGIAEITALLHDVGRFEQYKRYGTFVDHRSEDHAALGLGIIQTHRILKELEGDTTKLILQAVKYHNRIALPRGEGHRTLFFSKLLRDADKIDIWRVVTNHYQRAVRDANPAVELDLSRDDQISDSAFETVMNGGLIKTTDLKTLNDFKVLQMGWIYDINYPRTFEMIREKGYLELIRDTLPTNSSRVAAIYNRVNGYLTHHLDKS